MTRLIGMLIDRRRQLFVMTIWSLLSAWLFFGGLALAEQVNLTIETSAQDEAALSQLASGLKPDVPNLEDRFGVAVTVVDAAESSPLISPHIVHHVNVVSVHGLPSLRLHQRVSVYRI